MNDWKVSPAIRLDLTNIDEGYCWPESVQTVLHLAGYRNIIRATADELRSLLEANVLSLAGTLAACGDNIRQFVFVSSMSVYAADAHVPTPETGPVNPDTTYALSKWLGEQACAIHRVQRPKMGCTIIRLAQVYGPGSPDHLALYKMIEQADKEGHISLGCAPELTRDYIHLDDAAEAIARVALDPPGGIINIGTGGVTMQEIADAIVEEIGKTTLQFGNARGADRAIDPKRLADVTGFAAQVTIRDGILREISRLRTGSNSGEAVW
jgi:nucleoside-diphosphate-sugar epimerase